MLDLHGSCHAQAQLTRNQINGFYTAPYFCAEITAFVNNQRLAKIESKSFKFGDHLSADLKGEGYPDGFVEFEFLSKQDEGIKVQGWLDGNFRGRYVSMYLQWPDETGEGTASTAPGYFKPFETS